MNRRDAGKLIVLAACGPRVAPRIAGPPAPSPETPPSASAFDAGPVDEYVPGVAVRFRNKHVIVIHDELGVLALSAICTHQACLLDIAGASLVCPCHGSEFSMQGDVLEGPVRALTHFRVTTFARRVHVDPQIVVETSARLVLP